MPALYSEEPENLKELASYFLSDITDYKTVIENADLVLFYDACAVQHHAALSIQMHKATGDYIKSKNGIIIITKCILMELGGDKHLLHPQIISFFKTLAQNGIQLVLMEESNVFDLLTDAYQSISRVNEILRFAVRKFNLPTSTIRESIKASKVLTALIGDGVISGDKDLCSLFFSTVKKNKQHQDNLGEQLIGICLYMLMHLVAEPTFKFSILTDDKGAARIIYSGIKSIPSDVTDKRPAIFSSIKLFQKMFEEGFIKTEEELHQPIKTLYPQNVTVLALMEKSDLETSEYTFTAEELAGFIAAGNEIRVGF